MRNVERRAKIMLIAMMIIAIGISSYVITRESNWYLTIMNGTHEMLYGEYDHKRLYVAAAITISAAYEKTIGRKILRFQPYIQLPTKGVGVGNIRLVNTGLHIGLTRSVH